MRFIDWLKMILGTRRRLFRSDMLTNSRRRLLYTISITLSVTGLGSDIKMFTILLDWANKSISFIIVKNYEIVNVKLVYNRAHCENHLVYDRVDYDKACYDRAVYSNTSKIHEAYVHGSEHIL